MAAPKAKAKPKAKSKAKPKKKLIDKNTEIIEFSGMKHVLKQFIKFLNTGINMSRISSDELTQTKFIKFYKTQYHDYIIKNNLEDSAFNVFRFMTIASAREYSSYKITNLSFNEKTLSYSYREIGWSFQDHSYDYDDDDESESPYLEDYDFLRETVYNYTFHPIWMPIFIEFEKNYRQGNFKFLMELETK